MASKAYRGIRQDILGASPLDWANGSKVFRIMLVNASYTFVRTHAFVSDVSANELSGTGYLRKTLASRTINDDSTNDRVWLGATNPVWTGINAGTIGGAIIYEQTGGDDTTPTNDRVCFFLDPTDLVTNGSDVTLNFDATNGIAYI